MGITIDVVNENNINVEVTPQATTTITIDRGVAGVGIESVAVVYIDPNYYLDFTYTNGTNELVELPAIAAGVTSFNTRIGVVTLTSLDVTDALGFTPPTPTGTGASGTWAISVSGNAATATNGIVSTGSYSDPSWITDLNASKIIGTLSVSNGGTGVNTSTGSGNVVLSTSPTLVTPVLGTPASGNLVNCTFPTLNQNTSGTAAGLSSTLVATSGGTGQSTVTTGDLLIGGTNSWSKLAIGSNGQILKVTSGAPVWSTDAVGTVTSITAGTGLSGGVITSTGTIAIDSTVATLTGTQTLTNKTISGASNTLTNIANASLTNSSVTVGTTAIALGASSLTLGGLTTVTVTQDPTAALDLTTKQYVDAVAQGLDPKASCVAATTANITLSGTQTIDGILLIAGDRCLVKNQTLSQNNGIYLVASGAWTRTTDMDVWAEVPGAFTFIEQGTTQADTGWVCTSNSGGTIGTTAITFVQFAGVGSYTAGTGLTLTGTQFSLTSPVSVSLGGTGSTTAFTQYGVAYGSTTSAMATTAAGTSTQLLHGNASGAPTWSAVSLTADVSGTLPVANGGTGLTAGTSGGVLAYTAAGTLASSTLLAANALMIGGGAGAAPSTITTGAGVNTALGIAPGSTGGMVLTGGAFSGTSVTASSLTSGRVTYAGTAGLLQDSANLTFDGTTLTTTKLIASTLPAIFGSTSSTWSGTTNGIELQNGATLTTHTSGIPYTKLTTNGYYNGAWNYYSSNAAYQINLQSNSGIQFLSAISGTAGNPITFNQVALFDSTGLNGTVIGATTPSTGAFTTVTDSGLTSGRVTYAGTAGLLQDSAALTYDGTAVTINKNSSALPASPVAAGGMLLQLGNADAAQTSIVLDSFGNGLNLNFRRANGTNASKTGASGSIGQIRAYGYGSTAYSAIKGQISFTTEETWTDSAQGLRIDFSATPIGTTASSIVASMTGTGLNSTAIGATTPSTGAFTTLNATSSISKNSTVIRGTLNIGRSSSAVAASTTNYLSTRSVETTEALGQMVISSATTLRNLYVATSTTQAALGSLVVTIRKNGVATALTVTIAAGTAAGVFSDTTNSVTFAAGDLISAQAVNNDAVSASAIIQSISVAQDIG